MCVGRRLWSRRTLARLGVVALAASAAAIGSAGTAPADTPGDAPATPITVDGQGAGRVLAGFGAISGGGGTSRLLVDYPEPERDRILDYLFKPGYGAALQILKVEIGSDTNSSNGAEQSHMRTPTEVNCNRGYEWWLMEQAQKRNPSIQYYGLEWGAPGWFNGGFWSQDNINYVLSWLGCARSHHLHINYVGGWNERGWDKAWYEALKTALVNHGYGDVKVVAADNGGWQVATDMKNDPAFNAATDVVGIHYPCSILHCSGAPDAIGLGKPLFASESGWNDYLTGADRLASEINHEYVDARITGFINWPAAYAWYPTVELAGAGLLRANEPWSGHYELGPTLWTLAQTTQFTRPGWSYVDSGSGYLGGGGTYVSLRSPTNRDYSVILETTAATAPQTVTLNVAGGLPAERLHVVSTQLDNGSEATWFARQPDLSPGADGTYTLTLQPGMVYTLSTLDGAKGRAQSPPSRPLALPYHESFEGYKPGATPRYFSDMEGAFQVAHCAQAPGKCLRQEITQQPITWNRVPSPVTLVGDARWTDYEVSTKALLEQPGTVSLVGRIQGELDSRYKPHLNLWTGYHLNASDTGDWSLQVVQTDSTGRNGLTRTLAEGTVAPLGINHWHRLALRFQGDQIDALIDGVHVSDVTDTTFGAGQIGLTLSSYSNAQFDDVQVAQDDGRGP